MKLLLDTCSLLWLSDSPETLSASAAKAISDNADQLYVSATSAFEIGIKHRKGRLHLGMEPQDWWHRNIQDKNIQVLPVTAEVALASTSLPAHHADPCDRIIIATAQGMAAQIVTSDELISQYSEASVVW